MLPAMCSSCHDHHAFGRSTDQSFVFGLVLHCSYALTTSLPFRKQLVHANTQHYYMALTSSTFEMRLQLSVAPQLPASMRLLPTTCICCIQCLSSVEELSNNCVYAVLCSEVFNSILYPCSNYSIQLRAMRVAKILGRERTTSYLKESFYSLLNDPALIVQSKLFNILPTIIGLMLAILA